MKEKMQFWPTVIIIAALIGAFISGQFTGYVNRRVAEGAEVAEIRQNAGQYFHDWIDDTNGRWVW